MIKDSYETLLTKSKYLIGLQCAKYLWMSFHEKHKIPKPDEQAQHIFDQGHIVGEFVTYDKSSLTDGYIEFTNSKVIEIKKAE